MTAALGLGAVALALVALWFAGELGAARIEITKLRASRDAAEVRAGLEKTGREDDNRRHANVVATLEAQLRDADAMLRQNDTPESRRARLRALGAPAGPSVQDVPDHDDGC